MHPIVEVTIDGQPVAGAFYERLISLSVTDKEGISSDAFQAELNDGSPDFLALPRTGAIADVRLGYRETGVSSVGQFTVDKVSGKCLPYGLSISGKSANLSQGKLKENKERHWDKKTLSDIIGEIAGESGLAAAVDNQVGSHQYQWMAQQDESDIHFLERLARRHNALFSIKDGRLIFAQRGSGLSSGGSSVGTVVITPAIIIQGTCTFEANDRTKYSKVVAYHQDKDKAERVEVEAEASAEGDSVFRIAEPFADIAEADKAAQAKAKQLKRGEGAAGVTVIGDTSIIAGAPLMFAGVRPGLDGIPYVIDEVTHEYSKSGFTTKITGKLYDGSSAGGGGKSGGSSDGVVNAASGGTDKVAPDSPAGTPATPSAWVNNFPRRNSGSTDAN
ncbi:phage late control D family protein [Mesorhizobium sp. B2-5-9]|uniref:phage late control D family protein n=1 Tax=Mesorhizobium sp. B2-5-9 TaxID=2589921 RepID=UPI00112D62F5|nr:contractile injection system protein, VgrG/Pvc8 family [Mesorhizobium sp. B2-5-9]TPK15154.1 phage late control D family protein [Mesorhizobium sp. B2-5-9]